MNVPGRSESSGGGWLGFGSYVAPFFVAGIMLLCVALVLAVLAGVSRLHAEPAEAPRARHAGPVVIQGAGRTFELMADARGIGVWESSEGAEPVLRGYLSVVPPGAQPSGYRPAPAPPSDALPTPPGPAKTLPEAAPPSKAVPLPEANPPGKVVLPSDPGTTHCPACGGWGRLDGKECPVCHGKPLPVRR